MLAAMFKRLAVGLLKGLLVGGAIGAAFHFGLRWISVGTLLGFLIAMGSTATAGLFTGKPPWRQGSAIESMLKAGFGLGVGALVYWLASRFANIGLPFELLGMQAGAAWTTLPLLFSPAIAGLYGTFVELDNTDGTPKGARKRPHLRVAGEEVLEAEPVPSVRPTAKGRAQ